MMVTDAIGKVFGIIMVVLYLILGTTFIFYAEPFRIPEAYAKPFGVLLYAYGLFRAYKLYRKYFAR
jgi:hypothetical protein